MWKPKKTSNTPAGGKLSNPIKWATLVHHDHNLQSYVELCMTFYMVKHHDQDVHLQKIFNQSNPGRWTSSWALGCLQPLSSTSASSGSSIWSSSSFLSSSYHTIAPAIVPLLLILYPKMTKFVNCQRLEIVSLLVLELFCGYIGG